MLRKMFELRLARRELRDLWTRHYSEPESRYDDELLARIDCASLRVARLDNALPFYMTRYTIRRYSRASWRRAAAWCNGKADRA